MVTHEGRVIVVEHMIEGIIELLGEKKKTERQMKINQRKSTILIVKLKIN